MADGNENEPVTTPVDKAVAEETANHLRVQQRLINRIEELSLVEDIARQLSGALTFDEVVNKMLEIALRITAADRAALATITETGTSWLVTLREENGEPRKTYRTRGRDDGILGEVMRQRVPIHRQESQLSPRHGASDTAEMISVIAVPLLRENAVIGILTVESREPNAFQDEDQTFLTHLAGHTVISIENHRLLEEHQHRISLLSNLQFLSMRVSGVSDLIGVESAIRETTRQMFQARDVAIFYYNALTDELSDAHVDVQASRRLFPSAEGLRAARTSEIQITHHTMPINVPIEADFDQLPPLTYVNVPVKGSHDLRAVLSVAFSEHRQLRNRDIEAFQLLAYQTGEYLEKARLQETIRAAHDRMRAILQSTRDGVLFLDREGRLVDINTAAERLVGIRREDVLGKNFVGILFQMLDHKDVRGMGYSEGQLVELARQLRTQPSRITKREFSRVADNKPMYIEEIGSPVIDESHNIVGRLLVLRDVTEQRQITEFRQDIVNMAVHDLRGPLGAIVSGLDLAVEDLESARTHPLDLPGVLKLLMLAKNSAITLISLVENVLEIARLETREMPINRSMLPLGMIAQAAVDSLRAGFASAELQVRVEIPETLPVINVDQDLIRRVITNLLDNALRYTPAGGQVLLSATRTEQKPDAVIVTVADSGLGIPPADRKDIFQVFRQVKGSAPRRGSRGSGLGLAFCRLAVEAHGGKIWVEESSPLGGACIAFSLPLLSQS